jgi:hypothetical protein
MRSIRILYRFALWPFSNVEIIVLLICLNVIVIILQIVRHLLVVALISLHFFCVPSWCDCNGGMTPQGPDDYTGCIRMIAAVWKLIIFTSMVKRRINTSRNERVTLQVYDTCLQMFDFFELQRKDCLTRSTLSSDTRSHPALFPLQRHPVVWNRWYQRLMLLGDGGSLLNCRRNARWTETTDSCFTNCSTQNAFCSGVTIIALLRHRPREKRGVGLCVRTKLEHLLFCSVWETYFCVRFESHNGRLKLLHSFWYTMY